MTTAKCFVHKQRAAVLQQMKAIIPETDCVSYFFCGAGLRLLIFIVAESIQTLNDIKL